MIQNSKLHRIFAGMAIVTAASLLATTGPVAANAAPLDSAQQANAITSAQFAANLSSTSVAFAPASPIRSDVAAEQQGRASRILPVLATAAVGITIVSGLISILSAAFPLPAKKPKASN